MSKDTTSTASPERDTFEQELRTRHDVLHDELTGLPNRILLFDHLALSTERARRKPDYLFGLLLLDVDGLEAVNDSVGRAGGDQVLRHVAQRISRCVRPSDTVARFSGDTFAVVIDNVADATAAARVAQRIQTAVSQPITVDGGPITPTLSIGITVNASDHVSAHVMFRQTEGAMERARHAGTGAFAVFDEQMHDRARELLEMEADLRRAFKRGEFEVFYQPVVDLETGRMAGVEALARWRHPERGLVLPATFLPMAEETGVTVLLDRWVLSEACGQLATWKRDFPETTGQLWLSVNLSPRHFGHVTSLRDVEQCLRSLNVPPGSLRLELDEDVFMRNVRPAGDLLKRLKSLGVQLQVDNFGTGYAAVRRLRDAQVRAVKVDGSLIRGLGGEPDRDAVARGVLRLLEPFDVEVMAEGVETERQRACARELGARYGQGYLFAPSVPASELTTLLSTGKSW